ncbi:thiolase family protein [bacterium]|nr:thiolase family protein [bacterium]
MSLEKIVIVAAKRTPFAKFGGSFSGLTATDLAVESTKAALAQCGLNPTELGHSIFGNVIQSSSDAAYLARHVALKSGASESIPAVTINRLCGSGFESIVQGAFQIMTGDCDVALVGGSENMTQVPYVARGARFGYRMGNAELEDALSTGLSDAYVNLPMAITAENLAVKYSISREEVDSYAVRSQKEAARAWGEGIFKDEVQSVTISGRKGDVVVSQDEHIRADATVESLGKLPPVFKKDGVVTAGNASGIVDGACSLIIAKEGYAKANNLEILGYLRAWGAAGCDPKIMGIGPVPATKKALSHYEREHGKKLSIADFKRVEVNEAFAAQYLAVEKELGLDREKTNVNGGAISIGHPLAASGSRLTAQILYELRRQGGGLGLATACIGGGQGMSLVVEVV